eukprot:CAMPEP_0175070472 /NCGR_PEP_ID=MMETSP0052_2-20121109/18735_1 /TAXON_ID=51329 ORGANISM="Polytomella parva, Strain SAG 63-3" /NCGR_SAMPLE_ID=MMETSP0052_2 /ASSEMBLY_ACC=CAM_ASM_000194 /LENGTH=644 /DNA_ID=CAMNT_0016337593 /DNA_START=29 /DNA_END=1960 /DNA_ORIENTATION=+
MLQLSKGALKKICNNRKEVIKDLILQIRDLKEGPQGRLKCDVFDGDTQLHAVLASQIVSQIANKKLSNGSRIRIINYYTKDADDTVNLVITKIDPIFEEASTEDDDSSTAAPPTKIQRKNESHSNIPDSHYPDAPSPLRAPPSPSPISSTIYKSDPESYAAVSPLRTTKSSLSPEPSSLSTAAWVTPGVANALVNRKKYDKIQSLNPYDTAWCLRARVQHLFPLRSFEGAKGRPANTNLKVELVDETGQAINGTFWGATAERAANFLQEGKVYIFHKFKVRPADKKYASVACDYEIDFKEGVEIALAPEATAAALSSLMKARVACRPIASLPAAIGQRAAVAIRGVVLSVGTTNRVKRRTDNTELVRRDLVLGDESGYSVTLTLWDKLAEEMGAKLEGRERDAVVVATQVRVTDFNGCSATTLTRSEFQIDPEGEEVENLRTWMASEEGRNCLFPQIGQDLRDSSKAARSDRGQALSPEEAAAAAEALLRPTLTSDLDRVASEIVAATAVSGSGSGSGKAVYSRNMIGTVVSIPIDQQMAYLADPTTGKKVTAQGNGSFVGADGKVVETAEPRFVYYFRIADFMGEANISIFGKEAELLMGDTALHVHGLKAAAAEAAAAQGEDMAAAEERLKEAVKAPQWKTW